MSIQLFCETSENMSALVSNSIDEVMTTPPYSLGEGGLPESGINVSQYLRLLRLVEDVFNECYRVLKPGGLLIFTAGTILSNGTHYPFSFELIGKLLSSDTVEWRFKEYLVSDFNVRSGRRIARFLSNRQAKYYYPQLTTDHVFILQKPGNYHRGEHSINDYVPTSNLWPKHFDKSTDHGGIWSESFVYTLIQLYSSPGDTILDPFCGTGGLGVIAKNHCRNFVGYDIEPKYIKIATERLNSYASV